ncbi:MAG: alcohol dehydrogenase catalytic domain-containing protein, partial [Cyclobacteriaceae bacterium]
MKSVAIINPLITERHESFSPSGRVKLEKTSLHVGLLETEDPGLEENNQSSNQVLLKKEAFSCNYRDKGILINLNSGLIHKAKLDPGSLPYAFFGSEFVGVVVKTGKGVTHLKEGDRVIPDCVYQNPGTDVSIGVPSNTTSQVYEILPANKLVKIPDIMPTNQAAGFSIGAQTAWAMIRKTAISKDSKV